MYMGRSCSIQAKKFRGFRKESSQLRGGEDEDPSEQRHQRRKGIEPHPIRTRHIGRASSQQHQAHDLSHELHQNTRHDERVNDGAEREESRDDRDRPQHQQRQIRKVLRRVQPTEGTEKVAATLDRYRKLEAEAFTEMLADEQKALQEIAASKG